MTTPQNKKDCCELCQIPAQYPDSRVPATCSNPLCQCHSVAKEEEGFIKVKPDEFKKATFKVRVQPQPKVGEGNKICGKNCGSLGTCANLAPCKAHFPTPASENWEKDWLNFAPEYGKWKIDRRVAIPFIRSLLEKQRMLIFARHKNVDTNAAEVILAQAREEGKKEAVGMIEKAVDKMPRQFFKEMSGHEYLDTCDVYKLLQKLTK